MITLQLQCHPDTPRGGLDGFEATVTTHHTHVLWVCFNLTGDLNRLVHTPPRAPQRLDELWRSTCCEIFIRNAIKRAYREFNFAPNVAWQAYDFEDYRAGRRPAPIPPPSFSWVIGPDRLRFCVELRNEHLPQPPWRLNLAAVVEQKRLPLSYWALAHPSTHPDFHHPDAFVLELEPSC